MSRPFSFVGRTRRRLGTILLLLTLPAVPCLAQSDTPGASGDSSSAPGSSSVPEGDASSAAKPYGGPSVLSRDFSSSLGLPQVSLVPSVEIAGVYGSGLDGIVVNSQGGGKGPASFGTQYTLGLAGKHSWRHAQVTFRYSGSTSRYFSSNAYDGSSQMLTLNYVHMLNRHTTLSFSEAGGISSRSFEQTTVSSSYLPALDVYGNRTSSSSTQIALIHQRSARLSFSVAGNGGLTHQASRTVYDVGAVGVTADTQYRLSLRATAGASYSFSHYIYPGSFSSSQYHNVSGTFAWALSRRTEVSFSAGYLISQSRYLQTISLDSLLGSLTGASTGVVIHRQVGQLPSGTGRISRSFSRSSVSFSGGYTVTPGNGLFLTTVATTFSGSYSYTGLRKWGLSAGGSYSQCESIGTALGQYETSGASASASRSLGRFMHAVFGFSSTRYRSTSVSYYNRLTYQVRIGLGFSPGNFPLGPR
jgi:hypothetical protein